MSRCVQEDERRKSNPAHYVSVNVLHLILADESAQLPLGNSAFVDSNFQGEIYDLFLFTHVNICKLFKMIINIYNIKNLVTVSIFACYICTCVAFVFS